MSAVRTTGRLSTFAGDAVLEVEICASCGVLFAMPKRMLDARREDGESFYCPSGHSLSFDGHITQLKRERDAARDRAGRLAAELDQTTASLRATKGVVTKMKRRVANGVCPCCNRTFKDLAQHMESQHPGFVEPSKT